MSNFGFNPTFDGGGHIVPTPMISGCSSLNIDLEGSKFWYNSYFIVTMDILNVLNPKSGLKKSWSVLFESGVINQKFKVLIHAHCEVIIHTLYWTKRVLFLLKKVVYQKSTLFERSSNIKRVLFLVKKVFIGRVLFFPEVWY